MTLSSSNTNPAQLNATAANMALQLRNLMTSIRNFQQWFSQLSTGDVESLFGLSAADAATMQTMINYMYNVAGVYYGTVFQGGDGTANSLPIKFNFDNGLSILWGGQ